MKSLCTLLVVLFAFAATAQVPNYIPQNGLKSYYPFNGNTNDAHVSASHLTNNGAVLTADRNGVPNAAYSFDGTNQSMINSSPNFTFGPTSSFSVSVWVSKTTTTGGVALMNGSTAGGNFIWLMQGGATSMTYGTTKQQSPWIYLTTPSTVNVWSHYVCVYDNGTMTYYQDNVLVGTASFPYLTVSSANLPFYVGRGLNGGFYGGLIDDIGIWDRALSACEISDIFNSTATTVTVDAGADTLVCVGSSVTLNGTGSATLSWDQGVINGTPFTPLVTTTYTLTALDANGCSAWDQVDVVVNQGGVDGGPDQTLCDGSSVTLTGSNATGITWDNGVTDGVAFVPTASQTYTVSGTDASGCFGMDQVLITLYQPAVNAGADATICSGDSVLLNAVGADTYVWASNTANGNYFVPSSTGMITVVGTDTAGCSNSDSLNITVKPLSNIQAGPDKNVCPGQLVTLTATGGLFYIWDNGAVQNLPFTPQSGTNTYIVTGADASNCYNSDTINVTLHQPSSSTLTINAIDMYSLNGTDYTTSGTYTQIINNSVGCDSTITLNLTMAYTGLDENSKIEISWFPNPASDVLNVNVDGSFVGKTMAIIGSDGRIVKTIILNNTQNQIMVDELTSGVYICQIDADERVNFRWIKK